MIAASNVSYSGYNDMLTLSMMKSIWTDKKFDYHIGLSTFNSEEAAYSVSEILSKGLIGMEQYRNNKNMIKYQRQIFQCWGDPSLNFYWGANYGIEENLVEAYNERNGKLAILILNEVPVYCSIWDSTSQRLTREYGNRFLFDNPTCPETTIYIYKNGMKPIVHTMADVIAKQASSACEYTGSPSIEKASIDSSGNLSIVLSGPQKEGLVLAITEANGIQPLASVYVPVEDEVTDYTLTNPNTRIVYISLRDDKTIIDSKSILKK